MENVFLTKPSGTSCDADETYEQNKYQFHDGCLRLDSSTEYVRIPAANYVFITPLRLSEIKFERVVHEAILPAVARLLVWDNVFIY